jgi:hypothetical protein
MTVLGFIGTIKAGMISYIFSSLDGCYHVPDNQYYGDTDITISSRAMICALKSIEKCACVKNWELACYRIDWQPNGNCNEIIENFPDELNFLVQLYALMTISSLVYGVMTTIVLQSQDIDSTLFVTKTEHHQDLFE